MEGLAWYFENDIFIRNIKSELFKILIIINWAITKVDSSCLRPLPTVSIYPADNLHLPPIIFLKK